jgi:hypothetical protein
MEFSVGDKVKVINFLEEDDEVREDYENQYLDKVGEVFKVYDDSLYAYDVDFGDGDMFLFREEELEVV